MKSRVLMMIIALASTALCIDNDRKGFYRTIGFNAGFVPAIVYTSLGNSRDTAWHYHGSFPKYHGSASLDLHLGKSSGSAASSFASSFTWFFPSSLFDCSVFAGYAFTRYVRLQSPSLVVEFLVGPECRIISGLERVSQLFWGLKTGIKAGYEFNRYFTAWLGISAAYGYREYDFGMTAKDPNDLSGTPQYRSITISENMINGVAFIGGSYSF